MVASPLPAMSRTPIGRPMIVNTSSQPTMLAIVMDNVKLNAPAEARRLFRSRELQRTLRERVGFVPLPSPEEAEGFAYDEAELRRIERLRSRMSN